jgi:two-component system chemotaxis response regulator CheB
MTPKAAMAERPRVRVLIVDDSTVMRRLIEATLSMDPRIEIVATASDAYEARDCIKRIDPDVITLDIEMPGMNGLEFLNRLQKLRPTPVIMVSSLTKPGAAASVEAMALGAFDCVCKPTPKDFGHAFSGLAEKVVTAGTGANGIAGASLLESPRPAVVPKSFQSNGRLIVIGASTGGVPAITALLSRFPEQCPPTVIVQHMPGGFTHSFASRLDAHCAASVSEATDGDVLAPGKVLVAPGGDRHLEVLGLSRQICKLEEKPPVSDHCPSIDVLFHSVVPVAKRVIGILLTGMGRDGAEGLMCLRKAGAATYAQDEASSVVYGMARAAEQIGAVKHTLPLNRLADAVLEECSDVR